MIVLGIDPGPRLHGFALLDITRSRRQYERSGRGTTAQVAELMAQAELIGIEWSTHILGGFANHQRSRSVARQLIATQGEAGILVGKAGTRAVRIEAAQWRRGIVGTSSPTDSQVRAVIMRLVEGWPARSSAGAHACDAAGVALATFNVRPSVKPEKGSDEDILRRQAKGAIALARMHGIKPDKKRIDEVIKSWGLDPEKC